MNRDEDDTAQHAQSAEDAMQQELAEVIEAAKTRPIDKDEAAMLRFHCGLR